MILIYDRENIKIFTMPNSLNEKQLEIARNESSWFMANLQSKGELKHRFYLIQSRFKQK